MESHEESRLYPTLTPMSEFPESAWQPTGAGEEWLLAYSMDPSDAVSRWNFDVMSSKLARADAEDVLVSVEQDPWFGWTEHLAVRRGSRAERMAARLHHTMRRCYVLDWRRWKVAAASPTGRRRGLQA